MELLRGTWVTPKQPYHQKDFPNMDEDLLIAKQTKGLPHSQLTLHPLLYPERPRDHRHLGQNYIQTSGWHTAGIPGEGLRILSTPSFYKGRLTGPILRVF